MVATAASSRETADSLLEREEKERRREEKAKAAFRNELKKKIEGTKIDAEKMKHRAASAITLRKSLPENTKILINKQESTTTG